MSEKKYKDRQWMHEQYIERGLPMETLAREARCSRMTISRMLRKHGLEARDKIEAIKDRFK